MTGETPDVGLSLSREEIAALDAARKMTPLTLHMVVDTMVRARLAAVEAAHARDLAALRERAEVAEAKVAAVEGLVVQWERDRRGYPSTLQGRYAETAVKLCERELTAALADPTPPGRSGTADPEART